jgi:hypothetical protein
MDLLVTTTTEIGIDCRLAKVTSVVADWGTRQYSVFTLNNSKLDYHISPGARERFSSPRCTRTVHFPSTYHVRVLRTQYSF